MSEIVPQLNETHRDVHTPNPSVIEINSRDSTPISSPASPHANPALQLHLSAPAPNPSEQAKTAGNTTSLTSSQNQFSTPQNPPGNANSSSAASSHIGAAAFFPELFSAKQIADDKATLESFPTLKELLDKSLGSYSALLCEKTKQEKAIRKLSHHKENGSMPPSMKYTVNLSLGNSATEAQLKTAKDIARDADARTLNLVLEVRAAEYKATLESITAFSAKQKAAAMAIMTGCPNITPISASLLAESFSRVLNHEAANRHMAHVSKLQKEKQERLDKEAAKARAEIEVNSSPAASVTNIIDRTIDRRMKGVKSDLDRKIAAVSSKNSQAPAAASRPQQAPQKKNERGRSRSRSRDRNRHPSPPPPSRANEQGARRRPENNGRGRVYTGQNSNPQRERLPSRPPRERLSPQPQFFYPPPVPPNIRFSPSRDRRDAPRDRRDIDQGRGQDRDRRR